MIDAQYVFVVRFRSQHFTLRMSNRVQSIRFQVTHYAIFILHRGNSINKYQIQVTLTKDLLRWGQNTPPILFFEISQTQGGPLPFQLTFLESPFSPRNCTSFQLKMVCTYSLPGTVLLFISKWLLPIFTQELYFPKNNQRICSSLSCHRNCTNRQ